MPIRRAADVRLSNRPFGVKRFQTIHHYSVDVAHGLVLFGIGIKALPSWGFEDEVEQSVGRPCRQTDGRSKRTYDLTSSVVPRGTSFHRSVELEFPPIAFNPAWLSCCHQSTRCDRTQHPRQALRSRQCLPYWADKIVSYIPEWRTVSPQIDF